MLRFSHSYSAEGLPVTPLRKPYLLGPVAALDLPTEGLRNIARHSNEELKEWTMQSWSGERDKLVILYAQADAWNRAKKALQETMHS